MIEAVFIPKLTGEIPSRSSLNSVVLFRIKKKLSKIWKINKYFENWILRWNQGNFEVKLGKFGEGEAS